MDRKSERKSSIVSLQVSNYLKGGKRIEMCKLQNVFVQRAITLRRRNMQMFIVQIAKSICPLCKLYLSELQNVFVRRSSIVSPLLSNYVVGEKRGRNVQIIQNIGNRCTNSPGLKHQEELLLKGQRKDHSCKKHCHR